MYKLCWLENSNAGWKTRSLFEAKCNGFKSHCEHKQATENDIIFVASQWIENINLGHFATYSKSPIETDTLDHIVNVIYTYVNSYMHPYDGWGPRSDTETQRSTLQLPPRWLLEQKDASKKGRPYLNMYIYIPLS